MHKVLLMGKSRSCSHFIATGSELVFWFSNIYFIFIEALLVAYPTTLSSYISEFIIVWARGLVGSNFEYYKQQLNS